MRQHTPAVRVAPLLVALVSFAAACGGGTEPTRDRTPPAIVAVTPADLGTAPAASAVAVTFSEPVDPATITASTVTIAPSVPGALSVNGATVTFTPTSRFAYATTYTVTVTTGVSDPAGNALAAGRTWSFTTAANVAPTANAGAGGNVALGAAVPLSGTGTDPEGEALTYSWTQLAGTSVVGGGGSLTGASVSVAAPSAVTTLGFRLVVTDAGGASSAPSDVFYYVVENPAATVWVSPAGSDANAGTRAAPKRTMQHAIDAAMSANGDVYLQAGTYDASGGPVRLAPGVSLYGGYGASWLRDAALDAAVITGGTRAVEGTGVSNLVIESVRITAASAEVPPGGLQVGASSVGLRLMNASNVRLRQVTIAAGAGGEGAPGASGSPGVAGGSGQSGAPGSCDAAHGLGGVGGPSFVGSTGGAGGRGGLEGANAGIAGSTGVGLAGGTGGVGGPGGSIGGSGGNGTAGGPGAPGATGAAGGEFGAISGTYLNAGGGHGTDGANGSGGGGGGGGGGQGGVSVDAGGGNGGGGGGGGGGLGRGGAGGLGGGGSFALYLVDASGIEVTNSVLVTANGGAGGAGGAGGDGGTGGTGGAGANACTSEVGAGGNGGSGGAGGRGGDGGGGGGGPSIGIVRANSTVTVTGTTYLLGNGGPGGRPNGQQGQRTELR